MMNSNQKTEIMDFLKSIKYAKRTAKNRRILEEDREFFTINHMWGVSQILMRNPHSVAGDPEINRLIIELNRIHNELSKLINVISVGEQKEPSAHLLSQLFKLQGIRTEIQRQCNEVLIELFNVVFNRIIGFKLQN